MRTRPKEVAFAVSLLFCASVFAESETTPAATPATPVAETQPQQANPGNDAAVAQVAMQTDTPRDHRLHDIKMYPSF